LRRNSVNKIGTIVFGISLLAALTFSGCSQPEAPKPTPSAATPAPTVAPKLSTVESLTKAKENLTKALGELKDKNYRGAQDLLTAANTNLTAAAESAPAPVKAGIEKALANLAGIKDIKAPGTDKTLSALIASVSSLMETASKTDATLETAKGAMAGAAGAAGGALDKATGAAKGTPAPKK
jgi:hypothetical protein